MDGQTENVSISSFNKGRNRLIEKKTTTKSGVAGPGSHMAVPARRDGVFVRQSHHSAEAEQNSYVCFTILWHAANCPAEALKHADLTPQKKRHDRYMSIALRPRESHRESVRGEAIAGYLSHAVQIAMGETPLVLMKSCK